MASLELPLFSGMVNMEASYEWETMPGIEYVKSDLMSLFSKLVITSIWEITYYCYSVYALVIYVHFNNYFINPNTFPSNFFCYLGLKL